VLISIIKGDCDCPLDSGGSNNPLETFRDIALEPSIFITPPVRCALAFLESVDIIGYLSILSKGGE